MPEWGTLGSVRGDASNGIPYRDGCSGCDSKWGRLDIVSGHSRIPGGEQVTQRAVKGAGSGLQEEVGSFL